MLTTRSFSAARWVVVLSLLAGLLTVVVASSSAPAAEPTPVVLQWNAEASGSPVETVLSADGRVLAAMLPQGQVVRWNLATGKRLPGDSFTHDHPMLQGRSSELWFKNCRVLSPAFSVSGTTKLAPRAIASINLATGKLKSVPFEFDKSMLFGNSNGSSPADVSPDGSRIAIAADVVYLVNAATGKTLHKLTAQTRDAATKPVAAPASARTAERSSVSGLAFSWDSKHLAALDKDGTITVWGVPSGKVKATFAGQPVLSRSPTPIVWFEDNTLLTPSSITDGKLVRCNIETQQTVELSWSRPTTAGAKPSTKPSNPRKPKKPAAARRPTTNDPQGHTLQIGRVIAFSPDGRRVVFATGERRSEERANELGLVVVDLPAGQVIGELPLDPENVFAIDFSRDSQSLMIASRWGWYSIFRVVSLEQIETLARAAQPLSSVDHGLSENPDVLSWSRFREGDYVQHDVTVTHNLRTVTGIATHNLQTVYEDQSGIEVAGSVANEITSAAGPTIIPRSRIRSVPRRLAIDAPGPTLDLILGRFEGKTTPQGTETLNLAGQSYACDVLKFDGLRYDQDGYAYPVTGKVWSCPDVPGLVVKSSSVSKLRTELRVEVVLKQIVRK